MDDEHAVRVIDGRADPAEEPQLVANRQRACLAVPVDRDALDVLHHEVGRAVRGLPAVDEARDRRVIERGQDLPLAAETDQVLGGQRPAPHDLDRDALLVAVVVTDGEVNGPHPAAADLADQAIRAEPVTGGVVGCVEMAPRRAADDLVEERLPVDVRAQQSLDAVAQLVVAAATGRQVCVTLGRVEFCGGLEELPHSSPSLGLHAGVVLRVDRARRRGGDEESRGSQSPAA